MIDLETLSTDENSVVLSIGAVFFEKELGHNFYINLDINRQLKDQRTVNGDTFRWWLGQSEEARKAILDNKPVELISALVAFQSFILNNMQSDTSKLKVWGNGSTFDISIMENLFKQYNMAVPWRYSNVRDLRTFKEYVANDAPIERSEGHHNALTDAMDQANYVIKYTMEKK